MPTFLRGLCPSCRSSIEATVDRPQDPVECLRCGRQVPLSEAAEFRAEQHARRRMIWWIATAAVVIVLAFLAYHYRGSIHSAYDRVVTETGSKKAAWTCLSVGLVVLVSLLMWMFLPVAIYLGLRDLRRRTAGLETAQRAWVRHTARVNRPASGDSSTPRVSGTG